MAYFTMEYLRMTYIWHSDIISWFQTFVNCLCVFLVILFPLGPSLFDEKSSKKSKSEMWCTRLKSQSSCTAKHENNGTMQQTKCKDVFYEKGRWGRILFQKADCLQTCAVSLVRSLHRNTRLNNSENTRLIFAKKYEFG